VIDASITPHIVAVIFVATLIRSTFGLFVTGAVLIGQAMAAR
jgi:hypothetical protein